MITLDGGNFSMGSQPGEPGRRDNEGPAHQVSIKRFAMGRTDVTVGEFRQFVGATGYRSDAERNAHGLSGCYAFEPSDGRFAWRPGRNWRNPGWPVHDTDPVVCVSAYDAESYVDWLNRLHPHGYRLPSEAEWEYAARGGTQTSRFWGDDPNLACGFANVADLTKGPDGHGFAAKHECKDGYFFTSPVASFRPNGFGLYDMLGNAWQWTADCYNDNYKSAPADGRPWLSGECSERVIRGGSWSDDPHIVRSAYRGQNLVTGREYNIGFRVARDLP